MRHDNIRFAFYERFHFDHKTDFFTARTKSLIEKWIEWNLFLEKKLRSL